MVVEIEFVIKVGLGEMMGSSTNDRLMEGLGRCQALVK